MKLSLKTLLWSLPVWTLLIVDNYFISAGGIDQITRWINLPGMILAFLFSSNWSTVHDTKPYIYVVLNCLIYYGLIYLLVFVRSKFRSSEA